MTRSVRVVQVRRSGLTLLELLVAVAVLGVLAGLLVPAVQRVRAAAGRTACQARVGQLALAVNHFAATLHRLPRGCEYTRDPTVMPTDRQCGISWLTQLLPYLDQDRLWQQAEAANRLDPGGESAGHDLVRRTWLPVLSCPADGRQAAAHPKGLGSALASYRGVAGTTYQAGDGCFGDNLTVRPADVTDGLSNTLLVGERPPGPGGAHGGWYASWGVSVCPSAQLQPAGANAWMPANIDCPYTTPAFRPGSIDNGCDVNHFWSVHPGGATFATADGATRFLRYTSDSVLPALATRAGGEAATPPD